MALEVGSRLGPYSVTAKIGEGGMGEVYRARDTKLNRLGRDTPMKIFGLVLATVVVAVNRMEVTQ